MLRHPPRPSAVVVRVVTDYGRGNHTSLFRCGSKHKSQNFILGASVPRKVCAAEVGWTHKERLSGDAGCPLLPAPRGIELVPARTYRMGKVGSSCLKHTGAIA